MLDDIIKPITELPADADITTRQWSWYFTGYKGGIRHTSEEGITTTYEFPLAIVQVIQAVSRHDVGEVRNAIKQALGLPLG